MEINWSVVFSAICSIQPKVKSKYYLLEIDQREKNKRLINPWIIGQRIIIVVIVEQQPFSEKTKFRNGFSSVLILSSIYLAGTVCFSLQENWFGRVRQCVDIKFIFNYNPQIACPIKVNVYLHLYTNWALLSDSLSVNLQNCYQSVFER